MYCVRESATTNSYFVDHKIDGIIVETFHITSIGKHAHCSCRAFAESRNANNHFHIKLVEYWINAGKPRYAMYEKTREGKIGVLCPGIK